MSGARCELYVYYRVAPPHVQAALAAVRAFQQRLRERHPGLAARVLQRAGEAAADTTLMEIYAFDDGRSTGVDADLHSRIEEAAAVLAPLLSGPRKTEAFDAAD